MSCEIMRKQQTFHCLGMCSEAIDATEGEQFTSVEIIGGSSEVTIQATEGSTLFRLVRTGNGAQYYDSIVINFAA